MLTVALILIFRLNRGVSVGFDDALPGFEEFGTLRLQFSFLDSMEEPQ